eukprot:SAG11_NODE_9603_length_896_cov_1.996236_2_plen_68_part_01
MSAMGGMDEMVFFYEDCLEGAKSDSLISYQCSPTRWSIASGVALERPPHAHSVYNSSVPARILWYVLQ